MKKGSIYQVRLFVTILASLSLLTGSLLGQPATALAASATLTFSSKKSEVSKGEKITIILTVESDAIVGDVEAYVSYDPELLEFKTGGSQISGSDGLLLVRDVGTGVESEVKKYSMSFEAVKKGACEISTSDRASVMDAGGREMSVSSNRISVSVKETKKPSKNNNLKTLEVSPGTLTPEFHKDTKKYRLTVDSNTDHIYISALAEQKNAQVSIEGNENLRIGKNSIVIRVTAQNGAQKEYSILVTKPSAEDEALAKKEEQDLLAGEEEPLSGEVPNFTMIQKEDSVFIENGYRLKVLEAPDHLIPDGFIRTEVALYGETLPAYVPKEERENEFILLYGENKEGQSRFYSFDRSERTIQRFIPERTAVEKKDLKNAGIHAAQYNEKLSHLAVVIAVLSGLCVLLLLGIIRLFLKSRGYSEYEDD